MRASIPPIGTKILTYLTDESLNVITRYVKISEYDIILKTSIAIGLEWLNKHVFTANLEYNDRLHAETLRAFLSAFRDLNSVFNSCIIESCQLWNIQLSTSPFYKLLKVEDGPPSNPEDGPHSKSEDGPPSKNEDGILLENVVDYDYITVQVSPGVYHKFVYVKHNDHYDYLPMTYVLERYPELAKTFEKLEQMRT